MKTFFLLILALNSVIAYSADLTVVLHDIDHSTGVLRYRLCDNYYCYSDNSRSYIEGILAAKPDKKGKMKLTIADVPAGEYSFNVYHDKNNNDVFDRNLVGYPHEQFGVSTITSFPLGKPKFEKTIFSMERSNTAINVQMFPR